MERLAFSTVAARRPDIICIAGDLVYNRKPQGGRLMVEEQENVIPLLRRCASIAPTFMSLGNHESNLTDEDLRLIAEAGTVLLDNEWTAHGSIAIGGLTSHYVLDARAFRAAHPDYQEYQEYKDYNDYQAPGGSASSPGNSAAPPAAGSERLLKCKPADLKHWQPIDGPDLSWIEPVPESYTIILSHHPEYFPKIPAAASLVLSAHAHGGQFGYYSLIRRRMCGLFAPNQGWFPKYTSGVYTKALPAQGRQDRQGAISASRTSRADSAYSAYSANARQSRLVVTRGLTNTAGVPRIWNPTKIVYVEDRP